jgi:O-antigen/teichoic acid export membrane protein
MPFFYLMIAAILASVFFWSLPLIQSLGLARLRLTTYLYGVFIGALVAWWLTPSMGPSGTAIGILVANILFTSRFIYAGIKRLET